MFFKKNRIEVVNPMDDMEYENERMKYKSVTRTELIVASTIPVAAAVGFGVYQMNQTHKLASATVISEPVNVMAQVQDVPDLSTVTETLTPLLVNTIPQTQGVLADASLSAIATILDPIIQLLVAVSFPIASVIVICAFFLIMIGNQERAFDMIMKAGLGYILIQLSPMLLGILKICGELV